MALLDNLGLEYVGEKIALVLCISYYFYTWYATSTYFFLLSKKIVQVTNMVLH